MDQQFLSSQIDTRLQAPEDAFHAIINFLAIPTWLEDFSSVKEVFDQLAASGVQDFRAYFEEHPEEVVRCASLVRILEINQAAINLPQVHGRPGFPSLLPFNFKSESWPVFCQEIIALAEGRLTFNSEITVQDQSGGDRLLSLYLSVPPEYAGTLSRVLVSFSNLTIHKLTESALRESEERHRALFENSPVGIGVSQSGTHLYANPAYLRMFGFNQLDEIVGTPVSDRIAPEAREQAAERNRRREEGLAVESRYEVLAMRQDGSLFPVQMDVTTIAQDNGLTTLFFVQDITARRRAEEAEREQRLLAEALRDIAAALNRRLDFDQILDSILDNVGRVLANDTVDIVLFDEKHEAHVVREKGYGGQDGLQLSHTSFSVADVPNLARMQQTGLPVIVPDVRAEPDWVQLHDLSWVRSYAGIPIRAGDSVVGFINLNSARPNFYQPEHAARLNAMADQVAIAFTNAFLVGELRQANDRLQAQLSEIQALQAELRDQAIRDPLTGLFNRRYLLETLTREIERARRENWPVSIIVIDIDLFKKVNDAFGHKAGDLVLQALGELLKKSVRAGDIACRYGGEEFVIVMPKAYPLVAYERAEQIRIRFEMMRIPYEDTQLNATISLGLAVFPLNGVSDDDVLIRADRALYQAKQAGRNRTILYQNSATTAAFRK